MELLAGRQRLKDVWLVDGKLAESYAEVVLIDLRYYRQAVSEFVKQAAFIQLFSVLFRILYTPLQEGCCLCKRIASPTGKTGRL